MVCTRCGKPLPAGASFCPTCHVPGMAPVKTAGWIPPAAIGPGGLEYAGFWLRFLAYVIDAFALALASAAVSFAVGVVAGIAGAASGSAEGALSSAASIGFLAMLLVSWLYFAITESSAGQGTIGKMALGLAVTDMEGRRIGFARATGRFFAKLLSALPLGLGFVAVGLTPRKRGLHDAAAGTLVLRRGRSGVAVVVAAIATVVFGGIVVVGILAAIAIPNFVRYQLRAKSSEATAAVQAIAQAQIEHQRQAGRFVPLELPAAGAPGRLKMAWTDEDAAAAQAIGWAAPSATWFSYRVAVEPTKDGRETFSICAESDLDGDGRYAAVVLWYPTVNEAGNPDTAPPAPPCAHEPVVARPPTFGRGDPIGQPVRISPPDVF